MNCSLIFDRCDRIPASRGLLTRVRVKQAYFMGIFSNPFLMPGGEQCGHEEGCSAAQVDTQFQYCFGKWESDHST